MSRSNINPDDRMERSRETAEARAELLRRAEAQGIKPFDPDEWRAELETDQTPEEIQQEVDEFLRMVCESRHTPSSRSIS